MGLPPLIKSMPSLRLLVGCLVLFVFSCEVSQVRAQVNFYGAPVPGPIKPEDLPGHSEEELSAEVEAEEDSTGPVVEFAPEATATDRVPANNGGSSTATNPEPPTEVVNTPGVQDNGGIFSDFPVTFTSGLRMGYDTNVFTTHLDPIGSLYTNLSGGAIYAFGGRRLQLDARLDAGVTYYYSRPGKKTDYNAGLEFNVRYKVTPRLRISVLNTSQYLPQPELSIQGGTNRTTNEYIYQNTIIEGTFQIAPKFASVTSFRFNALYYLNEDQNDSQGRVEQTLSQSIQFLALPKTTLVFEYRANPVRYFVEDLNSFGQYLLVGINQTFNPRLTFTMRGGAEHRILNNPVDGQSTFLGPFYESNLMYKFGPASALVWDVRYGTEASGLANVTQRETFRMGLTAVHALTARITLNLGLIYQHNRFDQPGVIPDFTEQVGEVSFGAKFQVNRYFFLELGYRYSTIVSPDQPSQEYERQVVFLGGSLTI